jgi:hypothetical protein
MSEWFRSVPITLDNIAQAAKAGLDHRADLKFTQHLSSFSKKLWHHRFAITNLGTSNNAF